MSATLRLVDLDWLMRQDIWKKVGWTKSVNDLREKLFGYWQRDKLKMQYFSKYLKLWLLLLFGLLCCSFIVFIAAPPVASWGRKIRSPDRKFELEIVIRSAYRIFDIEILIRSAHRIQFIWSFSFKMKKHLKIKFSSLDSFYLILKIRKMAPLDFGI